MDIIISLLITFFTLLFSVYKGIFVGYPLLLCYFVFVYLSIRRGFKIKEIINMSLNEGKKSFVVLRIFVLIGMITGLWMASGTVPSIIYYGIKYMNPHYFILYSFLISSVVSFLLGTSLGTVSTVGLALILIAKSGNVNVNIVAGAIMSGAYFGDRCSPMSSSANLVANLTNTNLYTNISNMLKTSVIPLVLTVVIYYIFSIKYPANFTQVSIDTQIASTFNINYIILLPAFIILVFSLFKINVKLSMLASIITAFVLAIISQHYNPMEVLKFSILGFQLESSNSLHSILNGGGIISMWKAAFVVFTSCALSGIFNGTNILSSIGSILMRAKGRYMLFVYTVITSFLTGAFGCNQSISSILTYNLMNESYKNNDVNNYQLALDLENTGIVLAALIPWNLAAFVPTLTMGVSSSEFIPYAFYLYLIPLVNLIYIKFFVNYPRVLSE